MWKKKADKSVVFDSVDSATASKKKNPLKKMGLLIACMVGVAFAANMFFKSVYILTEEEQAVVSTFGQMEAVTTSGMKFKIPYLQHVTKVPKSIIGMTIGYDADTLESIDAESLMITKDFNFVNVDFYLEYRVSDPILAVQYKDEYADIIKNLAQSYIRDTIGVHTVDEVITTGKTEIQSEIETKLRERIIDENIGFSLERIMMQDSELPTTEVQEAFKSVESAKQGMETAINNANKYKSEQIPQATAQADKIVKEAEAYKQDRINEANGQVARFESMYSEYIKYPLITKRRLFYETMEEIMPDLKVVINTSDGTQTMLPLEPFSNVNVAAAEAKQ